MIIYEQEKRDGLEKAISSNMTIAYLTKPTLMTPSPEALTLMRAASGLKEDNDLYPIACILASVGWNSNDDVFEKTETFNARATPINKPFNYMHNEADIIGHMTNSAILDAEGNLIDNSRQISEIPDTFDVVAHSVLYKCWSSKDLQTRMDKIIANLEEWYVSMECLFGHFDYAIILPNGEHKVIARNKESAFLTKNLRVYGGTGKYEDYKIGRLLRGFAFSGKGLVDNPANKRSIIFKNTGIFNGAKASVTILKGKRMDDVLKAQLDEAKKNLEEVKAENKAFLAKAKEDADKAIAAQIAEAKETVKVKDKVIADKDAAITSLTAEKTKAEDALKIEADRVKVLTAEVTAMKTEAVKAGRLAKLASAGVTGEDATKLLDRFISVSEEMFDEVVAMKTAAKFPPKSEDKTDEDKKAEKAKQDKSKAEDIVTDVNGEKAVAAAKVEDVKIPADVTANLPVEDKAVALRASASAWIKDNVLNTKKENK